MRDLVFTNRKVPFWAMREVRWLIIITLMVLSVLAVLIFEIGPRMNAKKFERVRSINGSGRPLFVPNATVGNDVRFDGVLTKVTDFSPTDQWDEPYCALVRYLDKAKPETLSEKSVLVDYPHFEKHAAELRGRPIRVTGLVVHHSPLRLEGPTGGVEWIYRAYISSPSGDEGYIVDLLETPPPLKKHQVVSFDALFLKMATYEGKDGTKRPPLLLGRQLRIVNESIAKETWGVGTIIVTVAVVSVLVVIFLTLRIWSKSSTRRAPSLLVPRNPVS